MKLKLYKVTVCSNKKSSTYTLENFVIAGNEVEAKKIVEEEKFPPIINLTIKTIEEIDMEFPQYLFGFVSDACFDL